MTTPAHDPQTRRRRWQLPARSGWTNRPFLAKVVDEWPLLTVLAGVAVGIGVVASGHWRTGSTLIGAAVLLGGVYRALLPRVVVKLLAVRSRLLDAILMLGVGAGIVALAWLVPPSRG